MANHNRFDPLADKQEPEAESSNATTAVLPVEEITVQVPDQPTIVMSHSKESCDDKTGMVEEPIDEPVVTMPGESQEQLTLGETEDELAKETKHEPSDEEDFCGASFE